jgi:hypothetical protein
VRSRADQHPDLGDRPSLLFVAHRKELLHQSLRTFREPEDWFQTARRVAG